MNDAGTHICFFPAGYDGKKILFQNFRALRLPMASQGGIVVKNLPADAGDTTDMGLIPGSGRLPKSRKWQPIQYSCRENPMDRGAWWAAVRGVTKTRT